MWIDDCVKFLHILAVVFMSAPFYNLIVVNERALLLGPVLNFRVERYMENIIKTNAVRCFAFQITVLITGIFLVYSNGMGFKAIFTDGILLSKTILLLILIVLLSFVHLGIQPKIEMLLGQVKDDPIPEEIAGKIRPLRRNRTKLAAICFFIVLTTIILGMQVVENYHPILNTVLIVLAAIFSWRVYKKAPRFGWF